MFIPIDASTMIRMFLTHLANTLLLSGVNAGDIAYNIVVPPVPPATSTGRASNSVEVEIEDDEEPYETQELLILMMTAMLVQHHWLKKKGSSSDDYVLTVIY